MVDGLKSNQELLSSCIWQGLILSQILFNVFSNLVDGANCTFSRFVGDIKLEEWLTCCKTALPFKGPQLTGDTGWRNVTTQRNAQFCTWDRITAWRRMIWDWLAWKCLYSEGLQVLVGNDVEMNQQCTHTTVKASISGLYKQEYSQEVKRTEYSSLLDTHIWHPWAPIWISPHWSKSGGCLGSWRAWCKWKQGKQDMKKRRLLRRSYREVKQITEVYSERSTGTSCSRKKTQLAVKKSNLSPWEQFSTVKSHPGEVVALLFLVIFKTW